MGSISSHTRPVECLDGYMLSDASAVLYTADTMGIIKCWTLKKDDGPSPLWRGTIQEEFNHHRTKINQVLHANGYLWTGMNFNAMVSWVVTKQCVAASSDETVQVLKRDPTNTPVKPLPPIVHPLPVRSILPLALTELGEPYLLTGAGDILRTYDVSSLDEPELIRDLDAHWHDITAIRLWKRMTTENGITRIEPWIISTSLDGTIRKWRLSELLAPQPPSVMAPEVSASVPASAETNGGFEMTEEEERELAELVDSD
ncbi:hypothetical protein H0H87_012846 [Tephrocybe sp. NHM501043]|nr:hypothetical protein H0H87_012846 [Tephrocybe sp. NHM501043]